MVKRKDSDEVGLPHVVNKKTGTYKGRQVVDVAKRAARAERKRKSGRWYIVVILFSSLVP